MEGIKDSYKVNQIAMSSLIDDLNEIRYMLLASLKTAKLNDSLKGTKK